MTEKLTSEQVAYRSGFAAALDACQLAAVRVSKELEQATDHDKKMGMYGANSVWHALFNIHPTTHGDSNG